MRRGHGCPACRHTGYRGRIGLFELLSVDAPIRALIQNRATAAEIRDAATAAGMRTLRDDGLAKILAGLTTTEEIQRVTVSPQSGSDPEDIQGADQPV